MKLIIGITVGVIVLLVGAIWLSSTLQKVDSEIISRSGLHWHTQLMIYVKGERIEIPHNIGIGAVHMPMHTHEDLPTIHLEFGGVVKKRDLTLGQFFKIWDKEFDSFGPNVKMTVNGNENTELGSYQMKDGDKIELRYE